jgi:hypothetical protein
MAVWNKVGSNGAAWYSLCQRKKGGSDVVGTVRVGTVKKSVQTGTEQEIGAERERVGSDGVGDKGVGSDGVGEERVGSTNMIIYRHEYYIQICLLRKRREQSDTGVKMRDVCQPIKKL